MRPRDLIDLLLLAALWGGSFLFVRAAVHGFGPFALIELRVGIAALVLLMRFKVDAHWLIGAGLVVGLIRSFLS